MTTRLYRTDMTCGSCVAKIKPFLDGEPAIARWAADTATPDKVLTVEGTASPTRVGDLLGKAGFRILGEVSTPTPDETPARRGTYYPLLLLFAFLLGVVGIVEVRAGAFEPMRAMAHFMGGFFLTFSFFKLLDVRAFADAYAGYDLIASRSRAYALAYPFVELALGVLYLLGVWSMATNAVTLVVMTIGAAGVVRSLMQRRAIRCACLGAVFDLPMSSVTLIEDALMVVMAGMMLVW